MSIEDLHRFSAGSANDEKYKHLWVKGARDYIPQLNLFLKYVGIPEPTYKNIEEFSNKDESILQKILETNMSDKSTTHNYYILYSYIFSILGRNKELNILEIGLGTNNPTICSTMGEGARPGASLDSWEIYLPNSHIFGADIDKDILYETERIKTSFVDQTEPLTFVDLQKSFNSKYDVIIDDGLHSISANLNTLLFALQHLNSNGWIIVEDICSLYYDNWFPVDHILKEDKTLECFFVRSKQGLMYVVHKLV